MDTYRKKALMLKMANPSNYVNKPLFAGSPMLDPTSAEKFKKKVYRELVSRPDSILNMASVLPGAGPAVGGVRSAVSSLLGRSARKAVNPRVFDDGMQIVNAATKRLQGGTKKALNSSGGGRRALPPAKAKSNASGMEILPPAKAESRALTRVGGDGADGIASQGTSAMGRYGKYALPAAGAAGAAGLGYYGYKKYKDSKNPYQNQSQAGMLFQG